MRFNFDWLLGPRDWCVVDANWAQNRRRKDIYAIPKSRVDRNDLVLALRLRKRAARRLAEDMRKAEEA